MKKPRSSGVRTSARRKKTRKKGFEFPKSVKDAAWIRQDGKCAICGESLEAILKGEVSSTGVWETDEEYFDEDNDSIEAHHIVAVQSAIANNTEDIILRSVDNCVYVCKRCHTNAAHGGNTREGGMRPPEEYRYSHGGKNNAQRLVWLADIMAIWIQKYGPAAPTGDASTPAAPQAVS
jgi:hypothetical protein